MRDALPFTIGKKEKIDCIFLQKNISEGKLQHNALMEKSASTIPNKSKGSLGSIRTPRAAKDKKKFNSSNVKIQDILRADGEGKHTSTDARGRNPPFCGLFP